MLTEGEKLPESITWQGNLPKKGAKIKILANGKSIKPTINGNNVTVKLPAGLPQQSVAFEI
jgi:alpha-L-fucosidase